MTMPALNCLSEGETLDGIVRSNCAIGFDLRFCRSVAVIRADSEEEMIGIRDYRDSRMGRHFADDVVGTMNGCNIAPEPAIASAIRRWQDWRISRKTERDEGIPDGLPYLTGWVQHFAVVAAMAESG